MVVVGVGVGVGVGVVTTAPYNKAVANAIAADDGVMGWWSGRSGGGGVQA